MRRISWFAALAALPVALATAGCTDAEMAQRGAIGSPHKLTVYSGGQAVRVFHSDGKILTEEGTDGWYFKNRETGKLVRVSGTVVIEQE